MASRTDLWRWPTPERFAVDALRPASPIPGLFFAGSEVTSVGVIGAMMGGLMAAVAAEPVATMNYLRKLPSGRSGERG